MARGWAPGVVPHPLREKSIDSFTRTLRKASEYSRCSEQIISLQALSMSHARRLANK